MNVILVGLREIGLSSSNKGYQLDQIGNILISSQMKNMRAWFIFIIIPMLVAACVSSPTLVEVKPSPTAFRHPYPIPTSPFLSPTLVANVTVYPVNTPVFFPTLSPSEINSFNHNVESLIQLVKKDLSQKMNISLDNISVSVLEAVIWPDGSLGCGTPGTAYLPVPTPGYLIVLEANGQKYSYHTNDTDNFILCTEKPPVSIQPPP